MKYYAADLHIHSALSPCSDNDMIPDNILGMAKLKGINIISVTDHNSSLNVEIFYELSKKYNITVLPGIEVTTREEVHILCYFKDILTLKSFQNVVDNNLHYVKNNIKIFGNQIKITKDGEKQEEEKLLITSINLSFDELVNEVTRLGGLCVPAHIDRKQNSVLHNLGFIPDNDNIHCIEISSNSTVDKIMEKFPYLNKYTFLTSSDAHSLGDILERDVYLLLKDKSFEEITKAFKNIEGRKVVI